ncbi:hypothetical protein RAJCM14343_5320 [Rhodococcus aetherivorans]|uniref:Uncharacterized protein n=1 Tax=Rhodococcus aetherivorans TaxID=191292 RepID=A0ABQ0YTU6_9NOCA|nr:DUF6308 family protein [Rhodococcus aetherivorans]ETT28836.1 hypothetical protein RR21198_5811 [Rhodococcus rhodochrous ATCC 21198]KDE11504.1 hypothetical protein N505_0125100 [Rhodococcus aetherivorans]NGP25143.1 hypothetical protein [Rhodococcus aetherivorans]GES40042.1 hypothetical protein RAJCM14343_5320 [Rhodococcus aetherivorans]
MTRTGDDAGATVLVLAGRSLDIDTAVAKAHAYPKVTVARYDMPGPGPGDAITADDIARTHKVRSRISHAQRDWFLRTAVDAPWAAVPGEARLVDADPNVTGGLYDGAEALYEYFRTAAPRQVGVAKISKVLHLKRPGLFPILDSKVMACYRPQARVAATRYPHRGRRAMFWAAIRDDLCANLDSGALPLFRRCLAQSESEQVRRIATLTDVRLLDLLTWAIA